MIYWIAFVAAFVLSLIFTPIMRLIAIKSGIKDIPNHRSLHVEPIPKAGGAAIFFAFYLAIVIALGKLCFIAFPILAGAVVILLVGFFDDVTGISPVFKIIGQFVAAAVVISSGIRIDFFPEIVSIPLTYLWMIGIMNAMNLLDGMDGMAAGITVIASLVFSIFAFNMQLSYISLICLALAGASLGFLKYNFYRASIFMGDTGSLFVGYALGLLGVMCTYRSGNVINLFIPIIILGVPIFDTLLAIIRRIINKKPIFEADCSHFYEWLFQKKVFSYRTIVLFSYLACAGLGAIALLLGAMTHAR